MNGSGTGIAIALVVKAPVAGRVKTRLCPPLRPEDAAALYHCFLLDSLDRVRRLRSARPAVAYTPEDARPFFERTCPGFVLVAQQGPDLGARLASTFQQLFEDGFGPVVAIGGDTPTLPPRFLELAVELITDPRIDVVLGPCEDGGYYLIGLRRPRPELFAGISWSTDRVLCETVRRAAALGLTLASLPQWYDVDTPADLRRLQASLDGPDAADAPRTRRFFDERSPLGP